MRPSPAWGSVQVWHACREAHPSLLCPCWMCRGPGEQTHRPRWLNLFIWMSFFVPLLQQHSPEADPRYVFAFFFYVVIEILWTNTGSRSVILDQRSRLLKRKKKKSFCEYGSRVPWLDRPNQCLISNTHTHTHTQHTQCTHACTRKTDIPFYLSFLGFFKCILIYLLWFLPKEIHLPSIAKQLLLPP